MLPKFTVRTGQGEGTGMVVGNVASTTHENENWVGEGWIGYLMDDGNLIPGRWHRREDLWAFAPENPDQCRTILGRIEWEILDGYWGVRAELVLDKTLQWFRTQFEPTDGIQTAGDNCRVLRKATLEDATSRRIFPANAERGQAQPPEEESEIIKGGWDHEHCSICWEKISPFAQAEGYLSPPDTWVCVRCYVQYVQPRSLDFISTG